MYYFLLAFFIVLADQWLKLWVVANIPLYENIDFIPHIMDLTYIQNTGAAFSMFSNMTPVLTGISLVMSLVLCYLMVKDFFPHVLGRLSLAMILGGAVGNLIDRGFRGFVVDMFRVLFVDFAIFNIADSFVVVGGILAGIYYLFVMPPEEKAESETSTVSSQEEES
ncbi:MAG: signal peptidase II [Eubacteriales bacterium]